MFRSLFRPSTVRELITLLEHAVIYGWLGGFTALAVKFVPDPSLRFYILGAFVIGSPAVVCLLNVLRGLREKRRHAETFGALLRLTCRARELLTQLKHKRIEAHLNRLAPTEVVEAQLVLMLYSLLECFKTRVHRHVRLWVSLRQKRLVDDQWLYATAIRVGSYHSERKNSSHALSRNAATVRMVTSSFKKPGPCNGVIITGPRFAPERWTRQENDNFNEDLDVLMGGVWVDPKIANAPWSGEPVWIISVCADHKNVFTADDMLLMRLCIEEFAKIANELVYVSRACDFSDYSV